MITSEGIAREISELMLEVSGQLDASIARVQGRCPATEFQAYRSAVGIVMAEILVEVLNPLYTRHPSLRPPGLE
jgi:hypothetical protein